MPFTAPPGSDRSMTNPNYSSTPWGGGTKLGGSGKPAGVSVGPGDTSCPGGFPVTPAGVGKSPTCPPGSTKKGPTTCCPTSGASAGAGISLPSGGAGWTPGNVERPNLTTIDPKAEYDPEMAASLAKMRAHEGNLEQGSGHAMDVLVGRQADQLEAQVAQACAAAAQQGIPCNQEAIRANLMRNVNASMADEKSNREKQLGEQYATTGQMAGAQAGERNQRLEQDYKTQLSNNELLLDRYGRDIQKYGVDAQAATSANNALMAFYSQLMSGMFNMMGSVGSMSMNNTNNYG